MEIMESLTIRDGKPRLTLRAQPKRVSSKVNLAEKIKGGGLVINFCKCYTMRIYIHYLIWEIPILIVNIALFYIWVSSTNILTEVSFLAVAPVLFAVLVRDPIFLWIIYWSVTHLFCCKKRCKYHLSRSFNCIGGLHASFGVTALFWNTVYFHDVLIKENHKINVITITAFLIPLLFFIMCVTAVPCFRHHFHNYFEIIHRYSSWVALLELIVHIYFINEQMISDESDYKALFQIDSIFVILLVILTIYPWFIIHRIKYKNIEIIQSETATSTALILPISSPMGAICKLSLNWSEYHVFGITPLPDDKENGTKRSLVLIKGLGDWTKSFQLKVEENELQKTDFWIHRIKPPNFSQGLLLYSKVFALATGVGIAPLLPYLLNTDPHFKVEISLIWVARDHYKNYPQFILDVLQNIPNVVLYDTAERTRTDLPLFTFQCAKKCEAEAVFIVSNAPHTYKIANYLNKHHIPVFASNFDV
eukprot:526577_1